MDLVATVLDGILLGGLYALFASGLSLIFGVMRLVNTAHGDLIVLSAFIALVVTTHFGVHPLVSLVLVVPLMALLGYGLQRGIFNRTLGSDILPSVLVSFGLTVLLQNALLQIFSADSRRLQAGNLETLHIDLPGGIAAGVLPCLMFIVALVVIGGLQLLAAGIVAALLAVPTAWVIFRLKGAYFAIGTWVVAEVYRLVFAQVSALGAGSRTSLPTQVVQNIAPTRAARDNLIYWTGLGSVVAVLAVTYLILRSRWGLALTAIRDSESAAESVGVDNYRTKFLIYFLTAGATGSVGGLISMQKLRISPEAAFSVNDWTAFVVFIVVIGGIGRMEGPLIGTIVFFLLRWFLADLGPWYLMLLGAFAIFITLTMPKGIAGWLAERFDLDFFPLRRRVGLPKQNSEDSTHSGLADAPEHSAK